MSYYSKNNPEQPFQTKIVTNIRAINPKQANPIDICTMYSNTLTKAVNRRKSAEKDILDGSYKKWSGNKRVADITRALDNGWEVKVSTYCEMSE